MPLLTHSLMLLLPESKLSDIHYSPHNASYVCLCILHIHRDSWESLLRTPLPNPQWPGAAQGSGQITTMLSQASCWIMANISHKSQHITTTTTGCHCGLTHLLLMLLSSNAQKSKKLWRSSKTCHVGIHWKALTECFQMSTHLPWFQSFLSFLSSFHVDQISHQQHKG